MNAIADKFLPATVAGYRTFELGGFTVSVRQSHL